MGYIFVGLYTEGSTDVRFLKSVVQRTLEHIAMNECKQQIDPETFLISLTDTDIQYYKPSLPQAHSNKQGFVSEILIASLKGVHDFGINVLCVHCDADAPSNEAVYAHKIIPAQEALQAQTSAQYCREFVALVPIQMMEAWILADKELLKEEIGTTKTNTELGIDTKPELVADPKAVIEQAIRIAREGLTKRRRNDLKIGDIYLSMGQKIDLNKLRQLPSYCDFENNMRQALQNMNLLH